MNLLAKEKTYKNARFYVETYLEELRSLPLTSEGFGQAD